MIIDVTVEYVRVYKKEDGWFVAQTTEGEQITGSSILPPTGNMTLEGDWSKHPKYGKQFKARKVVFKDTLDIITALLASGFLTGVKQSKAVAMIEYLGERCFEILDAALLEPAVKLPWNGMVLLPGEILLKVHGIGPHVAKQILAAWEARRGIMNAAILGIRTGMGAKQFRAALSFFGEKELLRIVVENPYELSMVDEFTWQDVDLIAAMEWEGKQRIPHTSPQRLTAAIREVVSRQKQNGHLAFPLEDAIADAEMLADVQGIWDVVSSNLEASGLVTFKNFIATKTNYEMEQRIAQNLLRIMLAPKKFSLRGGDTAVNILDFTDLQLAEKQIDAVEMALENNLSIITGGPGTGKTTIINTLLNVLDHLKFDYVLCAPTGKAAIRMTEATDREAYTLHRYFELYRDEKERPELGAHYLIIDEFSMVSGDILDDILKQIPTGCRLVVVGDHNQLPPVGPGEPLTQMLRTNIPSTYLDVIFRQGGTSGIILAAHDIVRGSNPTPAADFLIVEGTKQDAQGHTYPLNDHSVSKRVMDAMLYFQEQGIPANEIQVLTPINGGPAGRVALNKMLHSHFNPSTKPIQGLDFKLGSRVIHNVNNYKLGVMNGEVGYVVKADVRDHGDFYTLPEEEMGDWDDNPTPLIWVQYPSRKDPTPYTRSDLKQLSLAYALTVHKSQGSEYVAAICVFMHTRESFMLRQLAYTAVTRAKRLCAVITVPGEGGSAFERFIANSTRVRRFSNLEVLIREMEVA